VLLQRHLIGKRGGNGTAVGADVLFLAQGQIQLHQSGSEQESEKNVSKGLHGISGSISDSSKKKQV